MTYAEALQEAKDGCKDCPTVNDCVKEECRWHHIIKALEKQIPQSPLYWFDGNEHKVVCPNCKHYEFDTGFYEWANQYCGECGQAIDWSDNE